MESRNFGSVRRACELIEELLEEPITINDLSRQLRASRSYFVRCFRDATGLPPSHYIRQLRLARGLERIRQGQQLADVAMVSGRSEEHTSELQSLMRSSYAVFCLKKKKTQVTQTIN